MKMINLLDVDSGRARAYATSGLTARLRAGRLRACGIIVIVATVVMLNAGLPAEATNFPARSFGGRGIILPRVTIRTAAAQARIGIGAYIIERAAARATFYATSLVLHRKSVRNAYLSFECRWSLPPKHSTPASHV